MTTGFTSASGRAGSVSGLWRSTPSWCVPARSRCATWRTTCVASVWRPHAEGGAALAAELDAKRATREGAELAARL